MMDKPNLRQQGLKKIKEYLLPIIFSIAVLMILFYYVFKICFPGFFLENATGFKELFGFSLAILSSGIFLAVLKWFQFMGFFRQELHSIIDSSQFNLKLQNTFHDVLYSDEFLQKRKDLEAIWKKVTRCYFKSEFPEDISDKINKKLSSVFFHNNKLSHFFRSCIITMNISIDEEGFLAIEETTESKLIRPSIDKFTYDFCFFIDKLNEEDTKSAIHIHSFNVDGKNYPINEIVKSEDQNIKAQKKLTVELEGQKEYHILVKTTLIYHIDHDNEYTYLSERVTEQIRVEVNHSPELHITFLSVGNEEFIDTLKQPQKLVKSYNDLLLPDKGFRLIFTKKN